MYTFAIVALLGLATLKVCDLLEDLIPGLSRFDALLRLAIGVAAILAIDWSMFEGFGISVREDWMGLWGTGLVVGSMATAWRTVLDVVAGYTGSDEGAGHDHRGHPRVAA